MREYNPLIDHENKTGGDENELFLTLVLTTLLVTAVFIDARKAVIPNKIVLLVLVLQVIRGIVSCSIYETTDRYYRFLTRCLTILFILFLLHIFFSIGAIGAGDLKLLAVTAVGFESPVTFVIVTFIIAAIMSLVHAIRNQVLLSRIKYLIDYVRNISMTKTMKGYSDTNANIEERKKYSIHFSLPIVTAYVMMEIAQVLPW